MKIVDTELSWREFGESETGVLIPADPAPWGDITLLNKDGTASYHLAVVVDDSIQGVTDVVRGRDIFAATSIHRLLQVLLRRDAPVYRHHRLILDSAGCKMSKIAQSVTLKSLRKGGIPAKEVRAALGFGEGEAGSPPIKFSWS